MVARLSIKDDLPLMYWSVSPVQRLQISTILRRGTQLSLALFCALRTPTRWRTAIPFGEVWRCFVHRGLWIYRIYLSRIPRWMTGLSNMGSLHACARSSREQIRPHGTLERQDQGVQEDRRRECGNGSPSGEAIF